MVDKKKDVGTTHYGSFHNGHGMMVMDCCMAHAESREHFETKKKMLQEKLKWVDKELVKRL